MPTPTPSSCALSRPGDAADVRLSRPGPAVTEIAPEALAPFEFEPEEYGPSSANNCWPTREVLAAVKRPRPQPRRSLHRCAYVSSSARARRNFMACVGNCCGSGGERLPFDQRKHALLPLLEQRPTGDRYVCGLKASCPRWLSWPIHRGWRNLGLAKVMVEDELTRARAGLGGAIRRTELSDSERDYAQRHRRPTARPAWTFSTLSPTVCWSTVHRCSSWPETTARGPVPGAELVTRLQELRDRPRLVVLASCQSAGEGDVWSTSDNGVLAGLGPRLAEIGIPPSWPCRATSRWRPWPNSCRSSSRSCAATATWTGPWPRRAARSVARATGGHLHSSCGSERPHLVRGRFRRGRPGLEQWTSLLAHIKNGKCTPILGPA